MAAPLRADRSNPRQGGPSFSLGNRLLRLAWSTVWTLFGIWTPVPLHGWRRFLVRLFGGRIAATAKIYPGVAIWTPRNLEMQDYSCLGAGVVCYAMDRVTMEPYALVSQRAHLCCGTHDIDNPNFPLYAKPIHIGRNAWVASEAFVGPGVAVGEGAVLGARGVATRNLDPWTVYAGNPAKPIRKRASF